MSSRPTSFARSTTGPALKLLETCRQPVPKPAVLSSLQSPNALGEPLSERVARAKARWLKRVMYETSATSTEKCFAYLVADHLNCATLDCWPSQARVAKLLGFKCAKTSQRAARGLERLGVLTLKRNGKKGYRCAPVFLPGDEDKIVTTNGRRRRPVPDTDVRESLLLIPLKSSTSTAAAPVETTQSTASTYDPRRRGEIEVKIAAMLGSNGIDVLARLAAVDSTIIDRLCRAYASGSLGTRELAAARLAAQQADP